MVLVCNEWENNGDDAAKSNAEATARTSTASVVNTEADAAATSCAPIVIPAAGAANSSGTEATVDTGATLANGTLLLSKQPPLTSISTATAAVTTTTTLAAATATATATEAVNVEASTPVTIATTTNSSILANKSNAGSSIVQSNENTQPALTGGTAAINSSTAKQPIDAEAEVEKLLAAVKNCQIMNELRKGGAGAGAGTGAVSQNVNDPAIRNLSFFGQNGLEAGNNGSYSSGAGTLVNFNSDIMDNNSNNSDSNTTKTLESPAELNNKKSYQKPPLSVSQSDLLNAYELSRSLQTLINNSNSNVNVNAVMSTAVAATAATAAATAAGLQKTAKQLNTAFLIDTTSKHQTQLPLAVTLPLIKSNENTYLETNSNLTSSTTSIVDDLSNAQAKIILFCATNSHPFQTRTIYLTPNVECMVGRLIAKGKAVENNAIFDCKVLSRKHAVIWYSSDGKFWVKDTKSSNGTFINDNKLGEEEAELHFGDIVKFGVDVLENTRKEVHGCIIACVKLYLPDGREAISIANNNHLNLGESRITIEQLHRLSLYIQEASEREKVLTNKLCSIQNLLDATRKNSALCWQSMITEDQLLDRIHSLEKKLKFMEKNVPENALKTEIMKLLDDKTAYQQTAKEALRKVYQERCDAMQMLTKIETAYNLSESECNLLRDQIMHSKQVVQEVNNRLLTLETEYNQCKYDHNRKLQEAKEMEQEHLAEIQIRLHDRELECDELKEKITQLLAKQKRFLYRTDNVSPNQLYAADDGNLLSDPKAVEDQLMEKQAMDKLDAVIANIMVDEENDNDSDHSNNILVDSMDELGNRSKQENANNANNDVVYHANGECKNNMSNTNSSPSKSKENWCNLKATPKRVKQTTIMKWLQNSDINQKAESMEIFSAICNDKDDGSQSDINDAKAIADKENETVVTIFQGLNEKCINIVNKLDNVQKNLQQLENELIIDDQCNNNQQLTQAGTTINNGDNNDEHNQMDATTDAIVLSNDQPNEDEHLKSVKHKDTYNKNHQCYQLLKSSMNIMREAYNEICLNARNNVTNDIESSSHQLPANEVQKQLHILVNKSTSSMNLEENAIQLVENRENNIDNREILTEDSQKAGEQICQEENSTAIINSQGDIILLEQQLTEYKNQVEQLHQQLQLKEMEAQQTLEIMQLECDEVKHKVNDLNKMVETLQEDKINLEQVIMENMSNSSNTATTEFNYPENTTLLSSIRNPKTTSNTSNSSNSKAIRRSVLPIISTSPRSAQSDIYYELHDSNTDNEEQTINLEAESYMEITEDMGNIDEEDDPDICRNNLVDMEREEELILYKERLELQEQHNVQLRNEIDELKTRSNLQTNQMISKYVVAYSGVVVAAVVIYLLNAYGRIFH